MESEWRVSGGVGILMQLVCGLTFMLYGLLISLLEYFKARWDLVCITSWHNWILRAAIIGRAERVQVENIFSFPALPRSGLQEAPWKSSGATCLGKFGVWREIGLDGGQ